MPYCPKCGAEVAGDGSSCGYCGEKVGNVQTGIQNTNFVSEITDDVTYKDKYPMGGFISVVMSVISLIMISTLVSFGMNQAGESGWSSFAIGILFFCMMIATVGIFSGLIGLNHPRKILSVIGLFLSGIFVVVLAVIIASSL
jgi:hypothetical protein